jgi:hypothetical protein
MNTKLILERVFLFLIVCLLFSSSVFAIGVSPIRKVVDFEPGQQLDLELKIRNSGEKDAKALVYVRGDMEEHIGIVDSLITLTPQDSEKTARYKLTLPDSLEKPGLHKTDLVVMEYPSSFGTDEGAVVTASASVVSELWVRVPYPGKYAEAKMHIDSGNVGEDVQFAISMMNFGKENIQEARAEITILGATYEELASFETNSIAIEAGGEGKLIGSWLADVNPGKYHVQAKIFYDEKTIDLEQNFEVGNLYIDIKEITVKDFSLGQVASFNILLESTWNEPINNVYGEMTVLDSSGSQYSTFKTASVTLPPMGEGTLKAYWDTEGVKVGTYTLRLLIHYSEKVTEKMIDTEVAIDSIQTQLGPTAQVTASPTSGRDTLLTVLVILLILINMGWFGYFIISKRKK